MTAQSPERIILDGRPHALYAQPLYRLLKSFRIDPGQYGECWTTANYRGYIATWDIADGYLRLLHLDVLGRECEESPIPLELRTKLLRAGAARDFPLPAHWFTGRLRIKLGRRLIYSHQGYSHWFERERVITLKQGRVVRVREVDTKAMLEWHLKRHPEMVDFLNGKDRGMPGPLVWFDNSDDDDWEADWWPPDFGPEEYRALLAHAVSAEPASSS
ncbi:hypothetical protein [Xanthobacter autotrophicus]|uniref:hypothetical protein n=1 Tax=Xanthobacter autotrophicus TaxID=280 RepID=UPI003726B469